MSEPGHEPRCPQCAASIARPEARFCEQCGAPLSSRAGAEPPPVSFGDVAARFRALQGHADLGALLDATPDVPELAGKTLPSVVFLALLSALVLFLSFYAFAFCPPLGFVPLALLAFLVYGIAKQ